jgi:hypothetical protein
MKTTAHYDNIFRRCKDMKLNKRYVLTPEQVEDIKLFWREIQQYCEAEFTLLDEENGIKIKKVRLWQT